MGNISSRFSRIFLSSRRTIARCWQRFSSQSDEGFCFAGEAEIGWPDDHSESFGDGTQVLEILFTQSESERMTIAVSSRENTESLITLFELVTDRSYVELERELPSRRVASVIERLAE